MDTFWFFTTVLFILLLIWAILFLALQSRRMRRRQDQANDRFIEKEEMANSQPKKDIDPALFFAPEPSDLPPLPQDDPHQIARAAGRTMIRFKTPTSNLDLKMQYGSAQIETIAQYEENFHDYLRRLMLWANALASEGHRAHALQIANYTIELGTEQRNAYKLAADIYAYHSDLPGLDALRQQAADHAFRDPAVGRHILKHIDEARAALSQAQNI